MTKFFGEFLIEKGIISEEDLLDALIQQVNSSVSIASAVYDKELLTIEEQLMAFRLQAMDGLSYRDACIKLKLWTKTMESEVFEFIKSRRKPIGEILISNSKLTSADLANCLDEFISDFELRESSRSTPTPDVGEVIEPSMVKNHIEIINSVNIDKIRITLESILEESSWERVKGILLQICDRYESVRISAKFIGASVTQRLMEALESNCKNLSGLDTRPTDIADTISLHLMAMDQIQELSKSLERFKSEDGYIEDSSSQFEDLLASFSRKAS